VLIKGKAIPYACVASHSRVRNWRCHHSVLGFEEQTRARMSVHEDEYGFGAGDDDDDDRLGPFIFAIISPSCFVASYSEEGKGLQDGKDGCSFGVERGETGRSMCDDSMELADSLYDEGGSVFGVGDTEDS
jgi:hypothetical protein